MILESFEYGPGSNLSYLIGDETTKAAAVVDPAGDPTPILRRAEDHGLSIALVLITHGHADHTAGSLALVRATGAKVAAYRHSPIHVDIPLDDGQSVEVGSLCVRVIYTPGHTQDGVCFLAEGRLFTGDTLFIGECGRTDLPGGDASALYDSLFGKLLTLPDETEIYPGHQYATCRSSSIGEQKLANYTLAPRSREEFMAFMAAP